MKQIAPLLVSALLALAPSAPGPTNTGNTAEIAVIVHPGGGCAPLDHASLQAIFSAARRSWPSGKPVIAFNYPPSSELRIAFDRITLHLDPENVSKFWIDQQIRGRARPPRQVPDPSTMLRVIARLEGSIGYVPSNLATPEVLVVARIRGGKVGPP